jgi:hypothetical protein
MMVDGQAPKYDLAAYLRGVRSRPGSKWCVGVALSLCITMTYQGGTSWGLTGLIGLLLITYFNYRSWRRRMTGAPSLIEILRSDGVEEPAAPPRDRL